MPNKKKGESFSIITVFLFSIPKKHINFFSKATISIKYLKSVVHTEELIQSKSFCHSFLFDLILFQVSDRVMGTYLKITTLKHTKSADIV